MQKIKSIVLLIALIFTACVGKVEPLADDNIIIEASKPQISVERGESLTIKVKNWSVDITEQATLYVTFGGEKKLLDTNEFVAPQAGNYTFSAELDGVEVPQKVIVVAYNDSELSNRFFRRHLVMKFTGTWCVNCPGMGDIITEIEHDRPFEIVEMAIHSQDEISVAVGERFITDFSYIFLPTVVVDMHADDEVTKNSKELVSNAISAAYDANPTVSGVRINSSIVDEKVEVEVGVIAQAAGDYKIAVALVADNYQFKQTGASSANYKQNKVLKSYATDAYGDKIDGLNVNEEKVLNYTIDMPADLPGECRVIAYVLNETTDGAYRVNNVTECVVGEEIAYVYELNTEN